MIIYGSRSSHLKSVQLHQETCPHCNTQGSLVLSTYSKYAHVFWIPLFPMGRLSVSECKHCKQVLLSGQMPAQIKVHHERNLAENRLPLWQFSGLALIFLAITFGVYASQKDKEQESLFLKTPMAGDVYEYKSRPGAFTTFKVIDVTADSLAVNFNNYEVDKMTGINQIDKTENYSDTTYLMARSRLMEMYAAGDIVDINRH